MDKKERKVKPKQYTHIDYEAILVQTMKERCSVEECLRKNGLEIARSTVVRNIKKIRECEEGSAIIELYEKEYVPNFQKECLPEKLQQKIDDLPCKRVIIKLENEDLYKKLSIMHGIIESCNGNISEAARVISTGGTLLGKVRISAQGLAKDMKYFERIKQELKKEKEKEEIKEGKEL